MCAHVPLEEVLGPAKPPLLRVPAALVGSPPRSRRRRSPRFCRVCVWPAPVFLRGRGAARGAHASAWGGGGLVDARSLPQAPPPPRPAP